MKLHVFYLIDGEYRFKKLKVVDEINMYENVGIYAFTTDKEYARLFQHNHDMNKFIHKIIEEDREKVLREFMYENNDKELFMFDTSSSDGTIKTLMTEFEYNLVFYGFPEICYDLTVDKGLFVALDDINKYKKKFCKSLDLLEFSTITDLVGWTEYPNEYDLQSSMVEGDWDQASIYKFIFSDLLNEV